MSNAVIVTLVVDAPPEEDPLVLEDFSDMRTQSIWTNPEDPPAEIWWGQFGYGSGEANISASGGLLTATLGTPDAGASKHQLYLRTVDNNGWHFIRMATESPATGTAGWTNDTYNRLRFVMKLPVGVTQETDGSHNTEFATFLHNYQASDSPMTGSDDNNWHFYHFINIPGDGLFWHVIIDTRVNHQRGVAADYGDQEYPDPTGAEDSDNVGKNYFDLMSSFYIDILEAQTAGETLYLKAFTMFNEDVAEALLMRCYGLTGTFDPATNTVKLAWNRDFNENAEIHEVAWSFSPITTFASATSVGTVSASGGNGATSMIKTFSNAAFASEDYIYIAIQPQGRSDFRTMWIDLSMND